ncbi:MAG TPA: hypothetical protein VH186_21585, partial [Chloroflexia bacterium]|nr:hypothetical protein [Chloroflexia bacterium]
MRNKLLVVGAFALAILVILTVLSGHNSSDSNYIAFASTSGGSAVNAQVIGVSSGSSSNSATLNSAASNNLVGLRFPAVSQRDRNQYKDDAEWRTWASSACSAASLTSVLNGFGINVHISDVLDY